MKKKKINNISVKEIKLSLDIPFGKQLKPIRKMYGYTLREMAAKIPSNESNICNFEKGNYVTGNSIRTAAKYAKALGIKQIKIIL